MHFDYSDKVKGLQRKVLAFMDEHIYPNENFWYEHVSGPKRWEPIPDRKSVV